jgi:hypothetical protein
VQLGGIRTEPFNGVSLRDMTGKGYDGLGHPEVLPNESEPIMHGAAGSERIRIPAAPEIQHERIRKNHGTPTGQFLWDDEIRHQAEPDVHLLWRQVGDKG